MKNRIYKHITNLKKERKKKIENQKIEKEVKNIKDFFGNTSKRNIWAFNSGNSGQTFIGNPKYLFAYINYYRPDVKAYWICKTQDTIDLVKSLGFEGVLYDSPAGKYAISRTGVAVSEQVKGIIPFDDDTVFLNLWHGIGFKKVERARIDDKDDMKFNLMSKYIKFTSYYQNNMITCCVNELQAQAFLTEMGIPERNILRSGYPRCIYANKYKQFPTYSHDILEKKGLDSDTKIAVYAPTFRYKMGNIFSDAIADIEKLYEYCEKNKILFIFKMHPLSCNEDGFVRAKESFGERPYFLFWDNDNDIYEVINKIDMLIYDYSSIFNDFLLGGVTHFVRYIFDGDNMEEAAAVENKEEYFSTTCGTICKNFNELLDAIDNYDITDEKENCAIISKQQWEFANDNTMDEIVDFTLNFKIGNIELPTLYSFDVFDTVISRKCLDPQGIFYKVQQKIREYGRFKTSLANEFPIVRKNAESFVRKYMDQTKERRDSFEVEVTLDQIYKRIQEVYQLDEEQTELLKQWEVDAEIEDVIPLDEQIDIIKELKNNGDDVVLISDMYLPKEVIVSMLKKADPILATLPLFLSNEYGVLKTSRLLYFEVYRSFKPYFKFDRWIHYGDNPAVDINPAKKINIMPRLVKKPVFSKIERELANQISSYDAFKVAAMQARLRYLHAFDKAEFVIDYVAPLMVSYVDWVLRDALKKGFETLYFVSRDGHPLKLIADTLISSNKWDIKTKYIYASRKVWRVPSYFDEIDDEFWADRGGNFNNIRSKEQFLGAISIEDETILKDIAPEIALDDIDFDDWSKGQPARKLRNILKTNSKYQEYLLNIAKEKRELSCKYLKQEIDADEKSAFVEFIGRGYNQECHERLWNYVCGKNMPVYYYYARSLFPSEGNCIRYNMTGRSMDLYFIEGIFANMPYKSIDEYAYEDNRVVPVIKPEKYDAFLYNAMEKLLPIYAREYIELDLSDYEEIDRMIFDFQIGYYDSNINEPLIFNNFGSLVDDPCIYGNAKEFAPEYTKDDTKRLSEKLKGTKPSRLQMMSYYRSTPEARKIYDDIYQIDTVTNVSQVRKQTKKEINENKRYLDLYENAKSKANEFEPIYFNACKDTKVENIISLLYLTNKRSDSFYSILKCLEKQNDFKVEKYCYNNNNDLEELAELLAKSKYVIIDENITILSGLYLRKETQLISTKKNAVQSVQLGKETVYKTKWRKKYEDFLYDIKFTAMTWPSDASGEHICSCYGIDSDSVYKIKGMSCSDVFYDEQFKENAQKKLVKIFPEAKTKKVLFYMPNLRRSYKKSTWLELLDLEKLKELIGDEYVVVLNTFNKKSMLNNISNVVDIKGFCKVINSGISLREVMCCADVFLGDYRATFFESVLLDKPIFVAKYDVQKKLLNEQNINKEIIQDSPFPIVNNSVELAEELKKIDSYDYSKIKIFKDKYLTYCDGGTAERLWEYIVETNKTSKE